MSTLRNAISSWLDVWDRMLSQPRAILLDRSLFNTIHLAIADLEKDYVAHPGKPIDKTKATGWPRQILGRIEQSLASLTDNIVRLYAAEYPTEITDLRQLLALPSYDLGKIYPLLKLVSDGPSWPLLKQELISEIGLSGGPAHARLTAISSLMARKAVLMHQARRLREMPITLLAREGMSVFTTGLLPSLESDGHLNSAVRLSVPALLGTATAVRMAGLLNPDARDLYGQLKGALWPTLISQMLRRISNRLAQELISRQTTGVTQNVPTIDILESDKATVSMIGRMVCEDYVKALLRQTMLVLAEEHTKQPESVVSKLVRDLTEYLITRAGLRDPRIDGDVPKPSVVDLVGDGAVPSALSRTLASGALPQVLQGVDDALVARVGERLVQLLRAEGGSRGTDWLTIDRPQTVQLCSEWLSRRAMQVQIASALDSVRESVLRQLDGLESSLSDLEITNLLSGQARFWPVLVEMLAEYGAHYEEIRHWLPWDSWGNAEIEKVIDRLFGSLQQPGGEWEVFFRVRGISPQGSMWSCGETTFYDPAVFNFGEGTWFPRVKDSEDVVTVRLVVRADASEEAVNAARVTLENTLSCLSFAMSVNTSAGGFRPTVDPGVLHRPVATGLISGRFGLGRHERVTIQPATDSELLQVAKAYYSLLRLTADDPSRLTELQSSFLRAVQWYRRGRWERDDTERFLFYWIGLEHIFVIGKHLKANLSASVPELNVTWRNLKRMDWYVLNLIELVHVIRGDDEIRAIADSLPDLNGWSSERRVLLQTSKAQALAAQVPSDKTEITKRLQEFISALASADADPSIGAEIHDLRDGMAFSLRVLYQARNEMVHEARPYRPEMALYADEVEALLESVLKNMSSAAVVMPPKIITIAALTASRQIPWS